MSERTLEFTVRVVVPILALSSAGLLTAERAAKEIVLFGSITHGSVIAAAWTDAPHRRG